MAIFKGKVTELSDRGSIYGISYVTPDKGEYHFVIANHEIVTPGTVENSEHQRIVVRTDVGGRIATVDIGGTRVLSRPIKFSMRQVVNFFLGS